MNRKDEDRLRTLNKVAASQGRLDTDQDRASRDFQQAKRRALLQELLSYIRYEPVTLLPFDEVRQRLKLSSKFYRGLQNVPLDKIIGSTGRYDDFTRTFMPRKSSIQARWKQVGSLRYRSGWPPVELYQVSDVFFVRDGNHRVSVSRQQRAKTIEAHVWEYPCRVPLWHDDELKDVQIREEYIQFLDHTGLDRFRPAQQIIFTERGRYPLLEEAVVVHRYYLWVQCGQEPTFQEAVLNWYDQVYMPMVQKIRTAGILAYFPGRTEADLVIWIINHQHRLVEEKSGSDRAVSILEAADDFAKRTRRNLWRRIRAWIAHRLLGQPVHHYNPGTTGPE